MNEKLNYEKRLALLEQEKDFYCKRLEEYETDQIKTSQQLQ